jgi:hypothetical protein
MEYDYSSTLVLDLKMLRWYCIDPLAADGLLGDAYRGSTPQTGTQTGMQGIPLIFCFPPTIANNNSSIIRV